MLFDSLQRQSDQRSRDRESEVEACFSRRQTAVAQLLLLLGVYPVWHGVDTAIDYIHERDQPKPFYAEGGP